MMSSLSIRKTVDLCGIHRNTTFYGNAILYTLQDVAENTRLKGKAKVDETF